MDAEVLARWQFGITTVYHFIFVPLTIGLAPLVALMQTFWFKTKKEHWLKLTKFFGKLFLINFALGVATGIVQEFQFGMNWSEYSRMVGDIFGAPLAMEALGAFFIESTFIGLWVFGWQRLSRGVHLACIWLVAFGVNLSAFFILAANSFMQHPVGAVFNEATGRAEMNDFLAVVTNNTAWATFPHTVATAFLVAGTFIAAICGWWIVKATREGNAELARTMYRPGLKLGAWAMIIAGLAVIATGDLQAKLMFEQQPMKMASAEAMCADSPNGAEFSILSIGNFSNDCSSVTRVIGIPGMTSFLAEGDFNAPLKGVTSLQSDYTAKYGAGVDYQPNLFVTYWSFRLMIGLAIFSVLLALGAFWYTRKSNNYVTDSKLFKVICLVALPAPFLAASFGWIFTEMGRQPWIVAPNPTAVGAAERVRMLTADGVSTVVNGPSVAITLVGFTLIYAILAVFWFRLMKRYATAGAGNVEAPEEDKAEGPLSFAY